MVGYDAGCGDFCHASMSGAAKMTVGTSNDAFGTKMVAARAAPLKKVNARMTVTSKLGCLDCLVVMVGFWIGPAKMQQVATLIQRNHFLVHGVAAFRTGI